VVGHAALILPLAYMAAIYHLSSVPGDAQGQTTPFYSLLVLLKPNVQNFLHIPMFGLLAWLWHYSLAAWMSSSFSRLLVAASISTGYGILDELHQVLVPGRFASLTDVALNMLGALVMTFVLLRHSRRFEPHSPSRWRTR